MNDTFKFQIKHRLAGAVLFTAALEPRFKKKSRRVQLGAAVKPAVKAKADLRGADLGGAYLRGADLGGAYLRGADLSAANLYGADLRNAHLRAANLRGAVLCAANLRGANLGNANLSAANLYGADLRNAHLRAANLRGADLRYADLYDANLGGAYLRGADLRGANLGYAKWSDEIILTKAPLQLLGLHWPVYILEAHMQIGCELHSHDDWAGFEDRRILEMEGRPALTFWRQHKDALLALCKVHAMQDEKEVTK